MALLVILFGLLLYIPFAGSYGLWDPWETHYAEVARQMTHRGDYISLWWPGSPRDADVFWSKPVLSFWMMSLAMHVAGIGLPGNPAGEMALGHRAEWAARVPFCLTGVLGIYAVYLITARFVSRRAGVLAAIVVATAPMYSLVARQAMTDMAFVGPMTMALALAGLALFDDTDEHLPRRGRGWRSWPASGLFYGTVALFALTVLPQLIVNSIQLKVELPWGGRVLVLYGVVAMIPYYLGFVAFLFLAARSRTRAPLYLYMAAILCALAVLAKGLAGLGLPLIVLIAYLAFTGSWHRLAAPADAVRRRGGGDRLRGGGGALAPRHVDPPRHAVLGRAVRRQPLAPDGHRSPRRSRHVRVLPARARLRHVALDRAGARGAGVGGASASADGGGGAAGDGPRRRVTQAAGDLAGRHLVRLLVRPGLAVDDQVPPLRAAGHPGAGHRRRLLPRRADRAQGLAHRRGGAGDRGSAAVADHARSDGEQERRRTVPLALLVRLRAEPGRSPLAPVARFFDRADRLRDRLRLRLGLARLAAGAAGRALVAPGVGRGVHVLRARRLHAQGGAVLVAEGTDRHLLPAAPLARRAPLRLHALLAWRDVLHLERDLRRADRGAHRVRSRRGGRSPEGMGRPPSRAAGLLHLRAAPAGPDHPGSPPGDAPVLPRSSTTATTSSAWPRRISRMGGRPANRCRPGAFGA